MGESYELEAYLWRLDRYGNYHPLKFRSDTFTDMPFNNWSRRVMFLVLATWKKLSMRKLLASLDTNGNRQLQSSVSGTLANATKRHVLVKKGKGIDAEYTINSQANQKALREYLPFNLSSSTVQVVKNRAKSHSAGV